MWFWSKEGQQLKKIVIEVNGGTITIFHIWISIGVASRAWGN